MSVFVDQTPSENLSLAPWPGDVVISDSGGDSLDIRGRFAGTPATVEVRAPSAFRCYSGRSGQGYRPLPISPELLSVALPRMPIGGPYDLAITQVVRGSPQTVVASRIVWVQPRNWVSKTLSLRRVFPPWYRFGPRSTDSIPLMASVEREMASRLRYDPLGTGDGTTTVFNLPVAAVAPVYIDFDGIVQNGSSGFLTLSSPTTVTFATPPAPGTVVGALYWAA